MIRALLVDDETRILEVLEKNVHWKECGIDYLFKAETMDEALLCYDAYKPEIVITDIEMPDGSGLELIERLTSKYHDVVTLCVTCHPEFEYVRKALQLGSSDYILKPVEYEELETILKKTVQKINNQRLDISNLKFDDQINAEISLYEEEKLVLNAKNYIRQHLSEDINVRDVADSLHCSLSHVMRIFKRETEKTIVEFITYERMEKSKKLLKESDLQISVVAKMCGYDDYSYFTRVFKKEVGITPREYRSKNSKNKK